MSKYDRNEHGPENPTYETEIYEFKGNKILKIPTGGGYSMAFGITKATAILEHIDEIAEFVETKGERFAPPVKSKSGKKAKDKDVPF